MTTQIDQALSIAKNLNLNISIDRDDRFKILGWGTVWMDHFGGDEPGLAVEAGIISGGVELDELQSMLTKYAEHLHSPDGREESIEEHFKGWADGYSNPLNGFIAWSYDVLDEILEGLKSEDYASLIDDVCYSIDRDENHKGEDFTDAVALWLKEHREELIELIEMELDDQ